MAAQTPNGSKGSAKLSEAERTRMGNIAREIAASKGMNTSDRLHVNEKSDSYQSESGIVMIRYDLVDDSEMLSVLLKVGPTEKELRKSFDRGKFVNEATFYSQVVKNMGPIVEEMNANKSSVYLLIPSYYGHELTEGKEWLAIEDFGNDSYISVPNPEQLDKEHIKSKLHHLQDTEVPSEETISSKCSAPRIRLVKDNDSDRLAEILTKLAEREGFSVSERSFEIVQRNNYETSGCCPAPMKRFVLQDSNKRLALVMKRQVRGNLPKKGDLETKKFRNEFTFYSNVSNRLVDYDDVRVHSAVRLDSDCWANRMCGVGKSSCFKRSGNPRFPRFPVAFASDLSYGNEYLVLEDLEDHLPCSDPEKMDKKHLKAAVMALATFHSACLKWKITNPTEYYTVSKMFSETELFGSPSDVLSENNQSRKMKAALKAAVELSSTNLPASYRMTMEKICDLAPAECSSWVAPERTEPWSTITHGDCWAKNFLFKYDKNKKITGVAMVDFKCVRASSPLMDVANLLLSSASTDCLRDLRPFIEKHKDTMFPKIADYRQHVLLAGAYGLVAALIHHYFCVLFPSPDIDQAIQQVANSEASANREAGKDRVLLVIKAARDVRMI